MNLTIVFLVGRLLFMFVYSQMCTTGEPCRTYKHANGSFLIMKLSYAVPSHASAAAGHATLLTPCYVESKHMYDFPKITTGNVYS